MKGEGGQLVEGAGQVGDISKQEAHRPGSIRLRVAGGGRLQGHLNLMRPAVGRQQRQGDPTLLAGQHRSPDLLEGPPPLGREELQQPPTLQRPLGHRQDGMESGISE